MSIIQISKIQVRSGDLVDLPQLDEGEFGFANDQKRLFIGKTSPIENVEILTTYSSLAFSQITGANGANLSLSTFEDGQVLAIADNAGNVTVTNRGATKGGVINLGSISNVKILGGSGGQIIITDGVGNLSFVNLSAIAPPSGSNTQVQFNDNGDFGGNAGFTFDKTTGNLAVPNNISLGSSLTTTQTTFNLANTTATTIRFGGAANLIYLGASGGGVNFGGNINIDKSINFNDANGSNTDTSVYYTNAGPEALVVALNSSSKMQIENGQSILFGNVVVSSGNIDVTATTLNLANANATTIQFGGSATTLSIGGTTGTTTVKNNLNIISQNFTTSNTTFNIANTNATTINFAGAATEIAMGAPSGSNTRIQGNIYVGSNGWLGTNSGYLTIGGPLGVVMGDDLSFPGYGNGILVVDGFGNAVRPWYDNTYDLGVSSNRWSNIYAVNYQGYGNINTTGKISYVTGAGSSIVQTGARTNGVTINSKTGLITLVSAAGSSSWTTFTVTNSFVTNADVIIVNQKSGTDQYQIFVTNVSAGTFDITFATTGGTTTETPEFNFAILGGSIT